MINTNFHTHTTFCDGKDTPEQMVLAAIQKGFSALGFSGHAYFVLDEEISMSEAQQKLDACNERGAEWHYLQAVVLYKKNWTNDSKKQLEIAMQMDPGNQKYRAAYDKMNAKNEYQNQQAQREPQNPYANEPMPDTQMGGGACSECISCCYTYLCIDCLFNLCCGCR